MVYSILTSHNDNHQYINHQYIKVIMDHYFVDAEKEEEDNHYDFVDAEKELR